MKPEGWSRLEAAYADPAAAARAHKAKGGRVAGYLSNTVPREVIAAAGLFPVQMTGVAGAPTPLADRFMEDLFDPMIRSVFQRLLAGDYAFLDVVVLPRTADSIQRLYYYLCEVQRLGKADLPEVLLFDLLHTPGQASADYNLARIGELKQALGRIGGVSIDDAALSDQIRIANRRRASLRRVVERRRARPPQICAKQALHAFAAWHSLDQTGFEEALDAALAAVPTLAKAGPRVILGGSALDNPALHRLVESLGATVVGDHHGCGEPLIGPDVAEEGAPLSALAEHYHRHVLSSRTFPTNIDELVDFAIAAGADGAVFYFFAEEEALTWEYPAQKRALEAAGIAVLGFSLQPYLFDPAPVTEALSGFLAALGQGAVAHV